MEGIDPGLIDRLVSAIVDGDWPVIVGGALLLIAAAALYITNGRISQQAAAWVSLVRGVFVGIGGPLVAGGDLKIALTAGCVGLIASAGFLDRIRALLPKREDSDKQDGDGAGKSSSGDLPLPCGSNSASAAVVVLLLAVVLSGCSVRQAQIGVRTGLTSADEGIAAADRIIAVDAEQQSEAVLDRIDEECPRPCFDAVERYREGMADWYDAARGLRSAHEALVSLDAMVEVWIQTGDLPDAFDGVCMEAAEAVEHLVESVASAIGDDPPALLQAAPAAVLGACQFARPFIEGDDQ